MTSQLPPATPKSVLRGHHAQIHATSFVRDNQRLASGDAEGYVALWDLTIMRPRAVWRAHTNAILGIAPWGTEKIITHGRDHRLVVWRVAEEDETRLSTTLPLDQAEDPRPQPWILHILEVNTMNFCSFGPCPATDDGSMNELLIAVPNTLTSESVDIYKLPSQDRLHTVHASDKVEKSGMVMALALLHVHTHLTLVVAHENGLTTVFQQDLLGNWQTIYRAQSHSQPVLSLDVAPSKEYFFTSGADALLVKHPIPIVSPHEELQSSKEAKVSSEHLVSSKSLLSAALAGESSHKKMLPQSEPIVQTQPIKILDTKHSGQQGLRIRSDGKIFATAGWDSKIRVYSARTMKELAVLKWHNVGCYTVSFANPDQMYDKAEQVESKPGTAELNEEGNGVVVPRLVNMTVKEKRIKQAKLSHWLAAGSKDGKISLWDIY